MKLPDYRITIVNADSKLRNAVELSFNHQIFSVVVVKHPDYQHPVFDRLINSIIKDVTDSVSKRNDMNMSSWTVKRREQDLKIKKLDFRSRFVNIYGEVEDAIEDWDYNRAPKGEQKTGKYGDLKAFLEMRKGSILELGDIK